MILYLQTILPDTYEASTKKTICVSMFRPKLHQNIFQKNPPKCLALVKIPIMILIISPMSS